MNACKTLLRTAEMTTLSLLLLTGCASTARPTGDKPLPPFREKPRTYACRRAPAPPMVDGRLDEPAWSAAAWTEAFVDIEGAAQPLPRFETRAKLMWDDTYLYIGADLQEPHVWATLRDYDAIIFHDNDFEIFIDPDGDQREYYEIEINAFNTIFDLFLVRTYIAGGPALHAWDCEGLRSAVHIDGTLNDPTDIDRGWSVEFAISWATLKEAAHRPAPPRPGDTWRMDFSRVQWLTRVVNGAYEKLPETREGNWVWSPPGVVNMHLPERWGYVTFTAE